MRPVLLNDAHKNLPEGVIPFCYIAQYEKEFTLANKTPIRTYSTNDYFWVADQKPGHLEGYLGRTDRKALFLEDLDTRLSYIADHLDGKEIFFTFDGLQFYKLLDIGQGVPLLFFLKNINHTSMANETKNVFHNHTTVNAGDGNTIVTGNNNQVTTQTSLLKGNLEAFRKELAAKKVPQEDIIEITEIVKAEKPAPNGQLGLRTTGWIEKMKQKAVDGTWEVSVGTAAGLLVELIKQFF